MHIHIVPFLEFCWEDHIGALLSQHSLLAQLPSRTEPAVFTFLDKKEEKCKRTTQILLSQPYCRGASRQSSRRTEISLFFPQSGKSQQLLNNCKPNCCWKGEENVVVALLELLSAVVTWGHPGVHRGMHSCIQVLVLLINYKIQNCSKMNTWTCGKKWNSCTFFVLCIHSFLLDLSQVITKAANKIQNLNIYYKIRFEIASLNLK